MKIYTLQGNHKNKIINLRACCKGGQVFLKTGRKVKRWRKTSLKAQRRGMYTKSESWRWQKYLFYIQLEHNYYKYSLHFAVKIYI